ncbi:MAG TPA: CHASE3 domain-containing protein [Kofleriaceae bacterium]|nr:CHASE3 domain-containing protein [Kofleriaceae bacterium]
MFEEWTFGKKLGAGFAVAGLALIVVGTFGYRSATNLIEDETWVAHSHQVRRDLASLLLSVVDTETGQRGYVITGSEAFLEPYTRGLGAIEAMMAELRRLTSDNPGQQRRLDRLRPLIDRKSEEMRHTIELRRTGFEAAQASVAGGDGKRAMDQIRAVVAELDAEENRLLERRMADAASSASLTQAVSLWGTVIALIVVAIFGWVITRSLSRQIGSAVQHVQSSSTELQTASTQQAVGAREQATAMSEISTTISELMATSRQIAESAQRVAGIARETAAAARSGDGAVEKGNEAITAIRRQVDLIVTNMLSLGKKSQEVGGVLDIVSELAEQTNILAINATIEAAGAGESGRRFAVVADEIRKLADRVAGATKQIREMVEDVRGAVNATIMTTEGGAKVVESGSRQFVEVAQAFESIAGRVSTTTDAAKEIELSTKQQATAVEQVNIAITNVAQQSKQSEVATSQTQQTASELAGLSRDLLRIVQSNGQSRTTAQA